MPSIAEQLLGANAGEIVTVTPDLVMSHENSAQIAEKFRKMGAKSVWDPEKIVIVLDHCAPAATAKHAQNHMLVRKFVQEQGIKNFFDVGSGICHQIMVERYVLPGQLVLGADSHTTMYGALGAFAAGIGRTDMAGIWALGKTWLRVPETIRLNLKGKLEKGVEAKDVILYLIGKLGAGGATYKSIEFCGEIVKKFSMDARFVLSNMAVEAGAKAGIIEADKKTKEWLKEARGGKNKKYKVVESGIKSDADAEDYDLTSLEPQIALPHRVDNVKPISKIGKVHVDQAFLGTCTNGRLEDLETAAKIVRDEKVKIRFIICPASREVYLSAIKTGAIQDLLSAGATIIPPGCGPCVGNHGGIPGDYEVVVSSANRNFKGRMGNPNASIYLASSATVAASALTGRITDPRDFL